MSVNVVSYGGGVQSTALLVLAARGEIDFRTFLFANVGDDSEHPASLRYVREVAAPYAAAHGIELVELQRTWKRGDRKGQVETLWGRLTREGSRSIPIPVRMSGGSPTNRACTGDFKIDVIAADLRQRGVTADDPATVALGISVDEIERARPGIDPRSPLQRRVYPLLDLGLSRGDCRRVIADGGLPVPPKSSCFFCPFHDADAWRNLLDETPELFAKSVELERKLNERPGRDKNPVFLTRHGIPLDRAVNDDQGRLDGMDGCDSGWCMT